MIRVSTLESFRRVVATAYGNEGELIAYIRAGQTGEPTEKMRAGTAWHKAIETGVSAEFRLCDVEAAQAHVGDGVKEIEASKIIGGHAVRGHCDLIQGLLIHDHKMKFSTPHAGDYEQSLQWRFYLHLFDADVFQYNLFAFGERVPYELKDIVSFRLYRYEGMEAELAAWVRRFWGWACDRGLSGQFHSQAQAA